MSVHCNNACLLIESVVNIIVSVHCYNECLL